MQQEYMTTGEAALILGISGPRVRQLCDDGRLEHLDTPLGRLVRRESVLRLAAERQRDPAVQRWERRKRRFSR
ncbi:helix-turn-helix domain-containing protein [Thermomicrobiaceae bacterium CFH 74404]|uniref:Helix-turn-helix domain-containing protein n=1 Tax=Thermalbibacter longus TaxID=2951981 RepID=A0AA41WGP8_9BACT|nr:helix-turn-helix domain-containing protein [Thermalbibacter longus]MCM8749788.1 helix-turn-helix domain-containing protein [Thermalbibacter longus]